MSTEYSVIYDAAVSRFSDYDFIPLDEAHREEILLRHLRSARSDFARICKFDLNDCDDEVGIFNEDLDNTTIEILALGVAYYWCSSKVLNSELFRNVLNTKDYSFFSPGSLLNNLRLLRDTLREEFHSRMIAYSYDNGKIAELKV